MRCRHLAGVALLVALALLLGADGAGAEANGPCEGTVAGEDVRPLSASDPSDAIDVQADDIVKVGATASSPISSYDVKLEFAGFSWNVASDDASGNSWQREVKVADYARFGVGLYKVSAVSKGVDCTGAVLVRIKGRNPLTTVAGAASAIIAAGAIGGGLVSVRRAANLGKALPMSVVQGVDVGSQTAVINVIQTAGTPNDYVSTICWLGEQGATWDVVGTVCYAGPVHDRIISLCTKGVPG